MGEPHRVGRELDENQTRYEYIAFQIDREDGLVNQRLTWTLQLNGFLFAALALVGSEMDDRLEGLVLQALPIAGVAVSLAGVLGTVAANIAIGHLKAQWKEKHDTRWPRPFGDTSAFLLGLMPSVLLPLVLLLVWIYLAWQLEYAPVA